jgi:hypothetical protein
MDAEYPLEFESVLCSPLGDDSVVLLLEGRWRGRQRRSVERAMLVVETDGRRYRFPAIPQPRRTRLGRATGWSGNFALPTWLQARLEGNTSLKLDDLSIPLPPGSFSELEASLPDAAEPNTERGPELEPDLEPVNDPVQTVVALRAELERRAGGEASVHAQLIQARAELRAQTKHQSRLEATQAELRRELKGLREAVERRGEIESKAVALVAQVEQLREQLDTASADRGLLDGELARLRVALANSEVSREAAQSEAVGLRAELDRLGAELVAARQPGASGRSEVDEAETLLAEARALRSRMHERAEASDGR